MESDRSDVDRLKTLNSLAKRSIASAKVLILFEKSTKLPVFYIAGQN